MTPAQLRRIVRTWQKRLKLEHFEIEVSLDEEPENPEALASCEPSDLYDYAQLRFRSDWPTHSLDYLNRIVVHELVHVMFRDYGQAIRSVGFASGGISPDVRSMWHDRCHDAEEAIVDRVANRLVELGGIVE